VVPVETTAQLRDAVLAAAPTADAVVMAAAPADYRPGAASETKMKKADDGSAPQLALEQNPDILAEISHNRARPGAVIVGFAAETGDATASVIELARAKLARKGCDLLVVNDVSGGQVFGSPDNEAVLLDAAGEATAVPHGSKSALSHVVWDRVVELLGRQDG
jgi:phosphopantothenoylcysteine decarboxylase/phosphopantothenate--cysteine ligase